MDISQHDFSNSAQLIDQYKTNPQHFITENLTKMKKAIQIVFFTCSLPLFNVLGFRGKKSLRIYQIRQI